MTVHQSLLKLFFEPVARKFKLAKVSSNIEVSFPMKGCVLSSGLDADLCAGHHGLVVHLGSS